MGQDDDRRGDWHATGPYWLRIGKREIRLRAGDTLIGRSEDCDINLSEALVSRHHARIALVDGELTIEDLGSANGTFVNQVRLHDRVPILPGDLVLVGTSAIEIMRDDPGKHVAGSSLGERDDATTPSSAVGVVGRVALSKATSEPSETVGADTPRGDRAPTLDLEGLESAGRLADRMFAAGRSDAAHRILEEPLRDILEAARSGWMPDPPLVDAVGRHALRLAREALDGRWVDVAVEIHAIAGRPLRLHVLEQFIALRAKGTAGSDAQIARYFERLASCVSSMDSAERMLCEQVVNLTAGLAEDR